MEMPGRIEVCDAEIGPLFAHAAAASAPQRYVRHSSFRQRRGMRAYQGGVASEQSVERDYARRGYHLAHRRWRGSAGEIDLIMRAGDEVIFVEVKHSRSFERAAAALSPRQMARLYRSAEVFLDGEPAGSLTPCRFDVALVDGQGQTRIIENGFGQG